MRALLLGSLFVFVCGVYGSLNGDLTQLYMVRTTRGVPLGAYSTFVQYVSHDAFLCALTPVALRDVAALAGVVEVFGLPASMKRGRLVCHSARLSLAAA